MVNQASVVLFPIKKVSRWAFAEMALALLLNGGAFHSNFKVRVDPEFESWLKINKKSKLASIQIPEVIVIEKATQLHYNYLEDLRKKLKDLKQNNILVEGILIILSEDFLQTLKIVTKSHQVSIKGSKYGITSKV